MDESQAPRWAVGPCFLVHDVVATAEFYRDKLGFMLGSYWGEPPRFTIVERAGVAILLKQPDGPIALHPNGQAEPGEVHLDAYLWVDDADVLLEQFQRNDVKVVNAICDQPWQMREFVIEDCNGYWLCFGHSL